MQAPEASGGRLVRTMIGLRWSLKTKAHSDSGAAQVARPPVAPDRSGGDGSREGVICGGGCPWSFALSAGAASSLACLNFKPRTDLQEALQESTSALIDLLETIVKQNDDSLDSWTSTIDWLLQANGVSNTHQALGLVAEARELLEQLGSDSTFSSEPCIEPHAEIPRETRAWKDRQAPGSALTTSSRDPVLALSRGIELWKHHVTQLSREELCSSSAVLIEGTASFSATSVRLLSNADKALAQLAGSHTPSSSNRPSQAHASSGQDTCRTRGVQRRDMAVMLACKFDRPDIWLHTMRSMAAPSSHQPVKLPVLRSTQACLYCPRNLNS